MRKVVAYELLSLDGVAESPDEFITQWDDAMDANLARVIGSQDAVLLGRRTYDDWAAFWPSSEIQPFADFINAVDKYVVTSSAPSRPWANTTVWTGDVVGLVRDLQRDAGGDVGVHGSLELVRSLLRAELVDELSLVVAPALNSTGRRLFDDLGPAHLTLTRHEVSPSGHLLLTYQFAR